MTGKETQIQAKIALAGEKEYREACKGINLSMREINSEMKLSTATFAENSKSTKALTEKQSILNKKLGEQSKQVEAAEKALAKMRDGGVDPMSPAYQKMQINLNNAKAEMAKTQKEIKATSDELKQSKVDWEQVGDVVGKVGKAFGKALVGLGTAAVGAATGLAKLTVDASNYADDLITMSTNTHISTTDLQKYSYALNFIDGDMGTLTKTMRKNTQIMGAARDRNKTYMKAYKRLGVSIKDANGQLRNGQDVYWDVIDALKKIKNPTERDALAMQLLGKSGTEVNTIIDAGSEAFKGMGDEAERMGYVMGEEAVKKLGTFNDRLQQLKAGATGLKNAASLIALPFLDDLAEKGVPILAEFSKGIANAGGDVTQMGDVLGKGISDVLNLLIAKLPEFVSLGVKMVNSLIGGISDNAELISQSAVDIINTLVNGIAELLPMVIEGAAKIIVGLATGLGQSLPTLVPTIVDVMLKIVQTLVDNIPLIIDAGLQLITGLVTGIINAIPVIVEALPQLITSILNGILEAIPQIIQAGIDLLSALVTALPEIIAAIVAVLPQIIDAIVQFCTQGIPMIIDAGLKLLSALVENMPEIINAIVEALPQIIDAIVNALTENLEPIIQAGIKIFEAIVQNMPEIIATIAAKIPQIIDGILQAFSTIGESMKEVGQNLLNGLWNGISDGASWLWDQVSNWATGFVDSIKNFFGIHSPSTVFAEMGGYMAEGIGEGFTGNMTDVESDITGALGDTGDISAAEAVKAVNDGILANIDKLSGGISAIATKILEEIKKSATELVQAGIDYDTAIAEGLIQGIVTIVEKIPQIILEMLNAFTAEHQKIENEGIDIDKNLADGMVKGVPYITGRIALIVQPIITSLKIFKVQFKNVGEDMVRGIWQGFQEMEPWLTQNVRSMMKRIVAAVRQEMKINSPSKVFATIGSSLAEGISYGFVREIQNTEDIIRRETRGVVPELGNVDRNGGRASKTTSIEVVQNIYANETSYAEQQRQAAKEFRQIAREVMV